MAFAAVKLTASEGPNLISSYLLAHNESNSFNALIFIFFLIVIFYSNEKSGLKSAFYVCAHVNQVLHVKCTPALTRAFETHLETGMCYASCN